jgi:PhnB protein
MATPYLAASKIFINVGGRASTPPLPGLDQVSHTSCRTEKAKRFSSPQQGGPILKRKTRPMPKGYHAVTPYLSVQGAAAAISF